eukprot:1161124-Pelagomonas_calceolata.AAC.12
MAQRPWSGLSHGQIIHQSFLLLAMYGGGPRRGVKGTPDSVCVSFWTAASPFYHTAVVSAHTQFARDDLLQRIPAHTQTAIPESVQPATSCSIKTSLNSINTNA